MLENRQLARFSGKAIQNKQHDGITLQQFVFHNSFSTFEFSHQEINMPSTEKSDIHFALNIKHSFYEEVLRIVPAYPLTLTVEELVSPSFTSRRASQYRRNPETSKPPRPPNAYILFRKNYHAEVKKSGKNVTIKEISNLTSQKWDIQKTSVKYYFEILAKAAREKHIEL
ncbi:24771_t:CDS:2, partial [Racocetra persica]